MRKLKTILYFVILVVIGVLVNDISEYLFAKQGLTDEQIHYVVTVFPLLMIIAVITMVVLRILMFHLPTPKIDPDKALEEDGK